MTAERHNYDIPTSTFDPGRIFDELISDAQDEPRNVDPDPVEPTDVYVQEQPAASAPNKPIDYNVLYKSVSRPDEDPLSEIPPFKRPGEAAYETDTMESIRPKSTKREIVNLSIFENEETDEVEFSVRGKRAAAVNTVDFLNRFVRSSHEVAMKRQASASVASAALPASVQPTPVPTVPPMHITEQSGPSTTSYNHNLDQYGLFDKESEPVPAAPATERVSMGEFLETTGSLAPVLPEYTEPEPERSNRRRASLGKKIGTATLAAIMVGAPFITYHASYWGIGKLTDKALCKVHKTPIAGALVPGNEPCQLTEGK